MTDKLIISRKDIEELFGSIDEPKYYSHINPNTFMDGVSATVNAIRALLGKAEVVSGEAVGYKVTGKLGERCSFKSNEVKKGDIVYTTPQPSRIAELEAEVASLTAIIDDIKVIDNVFGAEKVAIESAPKKIYLNIGEANLEEIKS